MLPTQGKKRIEKGLTVGLCNVCRSYNMDETIERTLAPKVARWKRKATFAGAFEVLKPTTKRIE